MKTLFLTGFSLLCLNAQAAVHTVNNNVPSPGQYTSVSAAISAATNGDTIYISASPYNYNGFTVNKELTFIGSGHKPQNVNTNVSIVDNIAVTANNVRIIGFNLNRVEINNYTLSGLVVQRSLVRDQVYIYGTLSDITLEGNVFQSTGTNFYPEYGSNLNGITVKNNIFNGYIYNAYGYYGMNNFLVKNNLFLGTMAFNSSTRLLTINNNIFYRANPANNVTNSSFNNNISYQCTNNAFPIGSSGNSGSGNIENADPLLVNFPAAGDYFSYTYDYNLQSTSPARNAGTDGKDIGLTGGDGYFQKYGIPPIPQMRQLSIISPAGGVVNPGGTLQIKVISTIRR